MGNTTNELLALARRVSDSPRRREIDLLVSVGERVSMTLLSMAIPLLHHGMLIVGVPYSLEELSTTRSGGTPYGASHVTWNRTPDALTDEEKAIARALGKRVAETAVKLAGG